MTSRQYQQPYQLLLLFVLASVFPLLANGASEEVVEEKHTMVVMRMIGHEVLKELGDHESRIMPIKKQGEQYKIPFEFEFGFDPADIVSIIEQVMADAGINAGYLVEIEQSEKGEVVHAFSSDPNLIPCGGRILPVDNYNLLITLLADGGPAATGTIGSALPYPGVAETNPLQSALFLVPLLILIGFAGFFIRQKTPPAPDPDLISIGASRFDKKNMTLTFENQSVELSNKESELLTLLHSFANAPLEREFILRKVWGDEGGYVGRTLDVFISKLRKKLEADTSVKIVNIRGVGYKLIMN